MVYLHSHGALSTPKEGNINSKPRKSLQLSSGILIIHRSANEIKFATF